MNNLMQTVKKALGSFSVGQFQLPKDLFKRTDRTMRFPYTLTAKIVQFPWVFYYKNNWFFRYYPIAILLCIPVFKKFSNMANTPNNKKVWAEIRRKQFEEYHYTHH